MDDKYGRATRSQMGFQLGSVSRRTFLESFQMFFFWKFASNETCKMYFYCSRDPASLVKPLKSKATPEDENKYNERLEAVKPTAVRHLILIRHGQYNLDGATDADRFLTEVGRKQAAYTGERLKLLKIPFDVMVRSTMTRAQETGKIISTHVANLPIENCSLIEEGAPIAPQPPIGHWHPEPHVSILRKEQHYDDRYLLISIHL